MSQETSEPDPRKVLGPNNLGVQIIDLDESEMSPSKLPESHRLYLEKKYGKPKTPSEPPANGTNG
jgi:hypothetical protein